MSSASIRSPVSPIQQRDIRSATLPFKRDKDHSEKWSNGQRPLAGVHINYNFGDELVGGTEQQRAKVRPHKRWSEMTSGSKSHANKNPKPYGNYEQARMLHKVDAIADANDHSSALSKSLLELVPQHANNANSSIQIALHESAADAEVLYSFDNKGPSPGEKGRKVDLGGLVELAEKKWVSEQTDRIVKGEYEVLDNEGEKTVLTKGKGKKGSPKQKAAKNAMVKNMAVEEVDGFELI